MAATCGAPLKLERNAKQCGPRGKGGDRELKRLVGERPERLSQLSRLDSPIDLWRKRGLTSSASRLGTIPRFHRSNLSMKPDFPRSISRSTRDESASDAAGRANRIAIVNRLRGVIPIALGEWDSSVDVDGNLRYSRMDDESQTTRDCFP